MWIAVRLTENEATLLYKNGDISGIFHSTCSNKAAILTGANGSNRISLRSRVWIAVRLTENEATLLYKNGDISAVIRCSSLKFGR